MPLFRDFIKETFVPRYIAVHDCVDTGNDLAIVGSAAAIALPVDGLARNKYNVKEFFNPTTSVIKDTIEWACLLCEFNFTINAPINTSFKIIIQVEHPTLGDIPVATREFIVPKNNTDYALPTWSKKLYNSDDAEAHLYGFNCYCEADQNCTLKARSLLITQQ